MPRLQHVSIPRPAGAGDVARAFYGGLVGLTEKPVPASITQLDLTWFEVGAGELELHVFAAEPRTDTTGRHFCLIVDDLEAMRQKLIDGGFAPRETIPIPGRPRFFCQDPFGNTIEFSVIEYDYRI